MRPFLRFLLLPLSLSVGLQGGLEEPLEASGLPPQPGQGAEPSSLLFVEATVLSLSTVSSEAEDPVGLLVRVEHVVEGWAPGSVLFLRVERQEWLRKLPEGARATLLLAPAADGSYRILDLESVSGRADLPTAPTTRPPRGYQPRPCGFDLDDDFVYGEVSDDCNICDGTTGTGPITTDYDGDTTDETEVYVDCTSGVNSTNRGGPSDPYASLTYAIGQEGAGEVAYCIKGTCTDMDLSWTHDGATGYKTKTPSGSEEFSFRYPSDPLMVVGWDADNDGEYPPYDADDTAKIDASSISEDWLDIYGSEYVEIAHFEVLPNTVSDGTEMLWKLENGGTGVDTHYFYIHDFEIDRWHQDIGTSSFQGVIGHWPNNSRVTYFAVENITCENCGGGFFLRGSAHDQDQSPGYAGSGPYRFKSISLTIDGVDGDYYMVSKPWGEVTGIEFLDWYVDYQTVSVWNPGTNPASNCFLIAQCVQDVVVRNNTCIGSGRLSHLQASAGGACTTRALCNSTAGSGTGCVIDGNEFIHDYSYVDDQLLQLSDPSGAAVHGDVSVTNNILNATADIHNCIEHTSDPVTNSTMTIVGNTFEGSILSGPVYSCLTISSGAHENWDVRNNVFGMTGGEAIYDDNGPTGWSADYNVYPSGTGWWRWNGSNQSTLANWRTASSDDANARQCSPTYVGGDDYHLNPADTCAQNQGGNIADVTTVDYDGEPRPQGNDFDIGADEVLGTGNTPPNVNISAPANGSGFIEGESILFAGTATDFEDGDLTSQLGWSSDLDGPIGSGSSFSVVLSVGTHMVTATVTDSGSLEGSDTVTVTVEIEDPQNIPPTVTITSPEENPALGRPVTSNGGEFPGAEASHIVDGAVNAPDSAWAAQGTPRWVEIDLGQVRTLGRLEAAPFFGYPGSTYFYDDSWAIQYRDSAGQLQHFSNVGKLRGAGTLAGPGITVTDGDPGTGTSRQLYKFYEFAFEPVATRFVRVTVTEGDVDGDSNGGELSVQELFPAGTPVTLSGSASDPEQGDLSASISWSSNLEGFLGTGSSITRSDLSIGNHTVTAQVADAQGEMASDSIEVLVTSLGNEIFLDDLETGDLSAWSGSVP